MSEQTVERAVRAADRQPLVEVIDANKTYGAIHALTDVSFTVGPGEVHALLGHNGAGKSTLVKVLSGIVQPDSGTVKVHGREVDFKSSVDSQQGGIALVDQELSMIPALSVEDNILLGNLQESFLRRPGGRKAFVEEWLGRLGLRDLSPKTMLADLDLADQQLVEIARALSRDADLLILDEPTATLNQEEIVKVHRAVREVTARGHGVIFVTHRIGEVLELCDRATVMREGKVVASRPVAELDRQTIIDLILDDAHDVASRPGPSRGVRVDPGGGDERFEIRDLTVPGVVADLDLQVARGTIVGLVGQVGSGTSDVLRAVAGLVPDMTGELLLSGRRLPIRSTVRAARSGISYVSNDRKSEGLFGGRSVKVNLTSTRLSEIASRGALTTRRQLHIGDESRRQVGVMDAHADSNVAALSGGNQQKVFLGRNLGAQRTRILLLDEPTRGVDVGGRQEIYRLVGELAAEGSVVIFASTELEEVLQLSDLIVTMFQGQIVSVMEREESSERKILDDTTHREKTS